MIPKDLVLEDDRVRLEPLDFIHAQDLHEAGSDDEIWRMSYRANAMRSVAGTCRYIGSAVYGIENAGVPFAIVDTQTGKAIGSTRYFDISAPDRKLEIGWSWLARRYWRTHVNTTCKLLLLTYAFETARALRVQFKADSENSRSRAAIERIGGTFEGTLRNFRVGDDSVRSVSFYSILDTEWPQVKRNLRAAQCEFQRP
ncbi:MAG: GNAT family N-acetyltransferase [Candidatus Eremiobacteraeota bacterium]|nr:GNAT family N-acetyltransferase [Candidatus Eremiobacteraeota bacterium]